MAELDLDQIGLETRMRVLGSRHVDRASSSATDFDAPFQELITSAAWKHVWSRSGISLRDRSMITIALLAALGHHEELEMHVRATRNTGASEQDIMESLLHVAIYAGVPAANSAFKIVKKTLQDMRDEP